MKLSVLGTKRPSCTGVDSQYGDNNRGTAAGRSTKRLEPYVQAPTITSTCTQSAPAETTSCTCKQAVYMKVISLERSRLLSSRFLNSAHVPVAQAAQSLRSRSRVRHCSDLKTNVSRDRGAFGQKSSVAAMNPHYVLFRIFVYS